MPSATATRLFDAIVAGDQTAVRGLLDAEPDLMAELNAEGLSPLMVALYRGKRDIAQDLQARRHAEQLTIHEAAATGQVGRLTQLLDADPAAANAWSSDGFQPLGLAAFFGHAEAVDLLLGRGAEINTPARHPFGVTALHAALAGPTPEIARTLIAAGADVNARQSSGETPLHETAFAGYVELAQLLLDHGANPAATDKDGRTPLDIARSRDQQAVADLLAQHTST